ncbi:MAG: S8 family peptidase [bacterium]|nr:S8 family peptidase [bacterium]
MTATAAAAESRRAEQPADRVEGAIEGIYVEFESTPGFELALTSLEPHLGSVHPELRAVTSRKIRGEEVQFATVFVPEGWIGRFCKKFEQYASEQTKSGNPRHRNLVERIAKLRLATLRALWTDDPGAFPEDEEQVVWWELWLRRRDGVDRRLGAFAALCGATLGPQRLVFDDRVVALLAASSTQLGSALDLLDDIAELRRPVEAAQFLADLPAADQREFVDELAGRLIEPLADAPATCLLDTGVASEHPLLRAATSASDMHAVDPNWSRSDQRGHGTEMAGIVVHGDVAAAMIHSGPVRIEGCLESVKVLPDHGENEHELYGALTAQAAAIAEVEHPERRRTFTLAVTAPSLGAHPSDLGQPSTWSSAVDALAAGRAVSGSEQGLVYLDEPTSDQQRLFVVSAGNIRAPYEIRHLDRSDLEVVEEPAQAWNALSVGAFTNLSDIRHDDFANWTSLAPVGELSPFSRTSVGFRKEWPHKPEVVFEGGNAAVSPDRATVDTPSDLQVLTTRTPQLGGRLLTTVSGTSPATAHAAHLATRISSAYPHFWPETIRGLIVHSARWTTAMLAHFNDLSRTATVARLRRYGWGVPDPARALRSADDAVTLIAQDRIHPYDDGKMREMHLHDLPWPTDVLAELGHTEVQMRVALSYFIEPNPARRGWAKRFRYASHGLRFEVRRPTETNEEFRKRINKLALAEGERRPTSGSDAEQWILGPRERVRGSLHVDHWRGPAIELAARGAVAVYPVTGWWKELKKRDRSSEGARYSLIVSIETPDTEVDVWTPVAAAAGIPITIETESGHG